MKKMLSLVFLLVGLLAYGSNAYASASNPKIDLQIRNAYIQKFTNNNSQYCVEFLCAVIQNNGPDDFDGTFSIGASDNTQYGEETFTGKIKKGGMEVFSLIGSPTMNSYDIYVDCNYGVAETNENNNFFSFKRNEPQVIITSGWASLDAKYYNDTIWVLPGEYFYSQFCLQELNGGCFIIGIDYSMYSSDLNSIYPLSFHVQNSSDGNSNNGTYSFKDMEYYYKKYNSDYANTTFSWMANSSSGSALGYWWLGSFEGEINPSVPVGRVRDIYIRANVALIYPGTTNTTNQWLTLTRTVKVIDRIRGDVNDDGVVDQKDLDILMDVVENSLHNPCQPSPNIYKERGLNYGAGNVLFSRPDFVSNCLINIWLHDKNDPLVQGLGIGELMSARSNSSVAKVANTFAISGNELVIDAPGADVYNVTAQKSDGKMFQATGKIGETISIPDSSLKYNVETVSVEQKVVTGIFGAKADENLLSVFPTRFVDQVTVSGTGLLSVFNANGQVIFTQELNEGETIATDSWPKGLYLFKIMCSDGRSQTVKALK